MGELSDIMFQKYAHVAGLGALLELKMRLLADKVDELHPLAYGDAKPLEEAVLTYFGSKLTSEEASFLANARTLRNKILHSDFKAAKFRSNEITPDSIGSSGAHQLKLSTNEVKPISETNKKEGKIFGWLIESMGNGIFSEAEKTFKAAVVIYDRVSFAHATAGISSEILEQMGLKK